MVREVGFAPPAPRSIGTRRAVDYATSSSSRPIRAPSSSMRGRPKGRPASADRARAGPNGHQGVTGSIHPRHVLLKKRVLSIEEYAEEIHGNSVSSTECMRRYGTPLLPIAVPLDPGESEAQHERRFLIWLERRGETLAELRLNANSERAQRVLFAKIKTKMYMQRHHPHKGGKRRRDDYEAQEDDDDDDDQDDDAADDDEYDDDGYDDDEQEDQYDDGGDDDDEDEEHEEPYEEDDQPSAKRPRNGANVLLRQRVLTADEYRAEIERELVRKPTESERLRLYGSTTVPVPVPLLPNESEDQYERRFIKFLTQRGMSLAELAENPGKERSQRMNFARMRVGGHFKNGALPVYTDTTATGPVETTTQVARPKSANISTSGSGTSSTHQPHKPTAVNLKPLTTHDTPVQAPNPPSKSKPSIPAAQQLPRTCSHRRPPNGSGMQTVLGAFLTCGCSECVVECTSRLVSHVAALEQTTAALETAAAAATTETKKVMDLTTDMETSSTSSSSYSSSSTGKGVDVAKMLHITSLLRSRRVHVSSTSGAHAEPSLSVEDPIELQLQNQYDELNDRVITNQQALDHAAAQLQHTPLDRVRDAAPSQHENQELRMLIEEEMDHRNAALAMLVVYMWRTTPHELAQRIQANGVGNIAHVQRSCHQKCATLAAQLAAHRATAATLTAQLDTVLNEPPSAVYDPDSDMRRLTRLQELGAELSKVESEGKVLVASRRRELLTLVHFDAHVRELIHALMQESEGH